MSPDQVAELAALEAVPVVQINTRDQEQKDWSGARRGVLSSRKKQLTLRLDVDLIDWFCSHTPNGDGYLTSINDVLREYWDAPRG